VNFAMTLDPFHLPEALNVTEVFLYRQAAKRPDATAIIIDEQVITYRQLTEATDRASAVLKGLGLEPEQRVLLMLPDVPQFASAWFATVKVGGVVSAVNPGLKAEEVEYFLNYTRAKVLVVDESTVATVDEVRARCPHLKQVLVVGAAGAHRSYDEALAAATPDPTFAPTHRDDVCVWLYTSGSTGFPKAAVHKQHDFVFSALTYGLPVLGLTEKDVCLSVPRLAFGYALGSNLLFPLLAGASTVLFKEKPTPQKLFSLINRHRPTVLTSVPTALNQLVNAEPELREVDFSSFRLAISAGEALPAELYQRWKRATGVEVLDGIGSAEMFHIFITNRLGEVKVGSLGKLVEGYRAKVCDDEGRELPRGEVGTLWVSGDSMALEYWQQHEKSKQTFRGDWCVSADKFQHDEDGWFFFCGRGDDMLKVGGRWLSPVEVENALLQHSAVREAAVVGFQDADGLEKPKAFVALQAGQVASEALAEALQAHVRETLAPFKAPRQVVFLDALPRSDRGKVLKTELRALQDRRSTTA